MATQRSLLVLEDDVARLVGEWVRICNGKGVAVLVYETRRSLARQAALYRQGRDDQGRRIRGERIVTMARPGWSWHNHGRAVDAVPWEAYLEAGRPGVRKKLDWTPFRSSKARAAWRGNLEDEAQLELLDARWEVLVRAALEVGLEWAGGWDRFREFVHWQHTGGRQIRDLVGEG